MKKPDRFNLRVVTLIALFTAQTFFLWMFFVAGGLERLSELGHIAAAKDANARELAFEFAARWRHGMTDGWPLYMPGFFVTAVALWQRALGLTLRRIVCECLFTGLIAAVVAWLLSSQSAGLALNTLLEQSSLRSVGSWPGVTARVISQGLFTLVSWSSFVLACQFAIIRKSLRPFLVPAAFSAVLAMIRPITVGNFVSLWHQRFFEGNIVAIFSTLLIPLLSVLLAWTLIDSRKELGVLPKEASEHRD